MFGDLETSEASAIKTKEEAKSILSTMQSHMLRIRSGLEKGAGDDMTLFLLYLEACSMRLRSSIVNGKIEDLEKAE